MAGEAILGSIVTEILKKLGSFLVEEINLAKGVKREVEKLQTTIGLIVAVISDAENKQVKMNSVGNWLKQLKDIAYEADDIVDEYAYDRMHDQLQGLNRKRDQVRSFMSISSNPIARSLKRGREIKDLNQKFDELASLSVGLGLKIVNVGSSSNGIETYAYVDESKVLGRDFDKSNIINMLLANKSSSSSSSCNIQNDKISVIPIVGMGGLGKTTLAQLVYNDTVVEKHFELRIWVYVSDVFDVQKLFIKIIESLPGNKIYAVSNLNVIVDILRQRLVGKKFLLVLDDVWNKKDEEWNRLKGPLDVGAEGSKILVTTRSEHVVPAGESYKLQTLKDDICLSIFEQRAFGPSCKAVKTTILVDIGKELVRKCGGLPLAAKALGSLMHSMEEVWEWEAIRDSKIWDNDPKNQNKILPALKLSYDHLLPPVKPCFSYCSLFPKGSEIERETLIRLWVAEGFIQPFEGRLMEEIGYDYLNNLLCNSFFQGVSTNEYGEITKFKMHDLIHDLAQSVAGTHECSIMEASEMGDISEIRRLNLLNVNEESCAATVASKSKLRTLFIQGGRIANYDRLLNNNKRLRVLDLSHSDIEELPASIGDLKHLRYLDLSDCWSLKKLPDSITGLYNLQTLKLKRCWDLKKVPTDLHKLINLRYVSHAYLPDWQDLAVQLPCLQNLNYFEVRRNSDGIGRLQCLNFLGGKLTISGLESMRGRENAEKANLKAKKYIKDLFLCWRSSRSEPWMEDPRNNDSLVLEGLQPHPNLRSLEINNFEGTKFPTWMSNPSCLRNLVKLKLSNCKGCKRLPALPSLRFVELRSMINLEEWQQLDQPLPPLSNIVSSSTTPTSSYPSLESIKIKFCFSLENMPTKFLSLKKFNWTGCNDMNVNMDVICSIVRSNLDTLTKLVIGHVRGLEFLPLVGLLKGNNVLEILKIDDCPDLKGFIPQVEGDEDLSLSSSSSLHKLWLCRCPVLRLLPDLKDLTSLQDVKIQGCNENLVISLPNGVENRVGKQ